ncbi:MAG: hypothetical protein SV966_03715 [Actinomycetota bacterium]|nr:hypothetical protein [Actinomycetota bacterium]
MAEREAPGDFDYRWDVPPHVGGARSEQGATVEPDYDEVYQPTVAEYAGEPEYTEPEYTKPEFTEPEYTAPLPDDRFDAFNSTTWTFRPPPTPWYRTRQAVTALMIVALALIALVVSAVLLLLGGLDGADSDEESTVAPTPSSTVAPAPSRTSEVPPPPPPAAPPPPPPSAEAPANSGPTWRQTQRPSQTNRPRIDVTKSPAIRKPDNPREPD